MSLRGEMAMLRVCGECVYASRRLESREIQRLKRKAHFRQRYFTYLVLLKRYVNSLDAEVFCRREKISVSLLDKACAFWRPHRQHSKV